MLSQRQSMPVQPMNLCVSQPPSKTLTSTGTSSPTPTPTHHKLLYGMMAFSALQKAPTTSILCFIFLTCSPKTGGYTSLRHAATWFYSPPLQYNITDYLSNYGRYRSPSHFKMRAGDTAHYEERPGELAGGLACVCGWNTIGSQKVCACCPTNAHGRADLSFRLQRSSRLLKRWCWSLKPTKIQQTCC